uniref:Selenoprotein N n=2 Tax=Sarcophilus harrisii TaxID=9305 RepID=A0A7N4PSU7_SARHA
MVRACSPGAQPRAPPDPPGRATRWSLVLLGALLAAIVAAAARGYANYREAQAAALREAALKSLGTEGLYLFSSLDLDKDLSISPEEFKPIAEKFTGLMPVTDFEEEEKSPLDSSETLYIDENLSTEEKLSIVARFQPLLLETMTKSKDGFLGVSHLALSGLREWRTPASQLMEFSARQFKPFLPPRSNMELGEPWWIIPSELSIFTGYLSNNRFYPPPPKGKEVIIHRLLSMFHPRPFVKTRFGPQGAVACLTAVSDAYYTVAFRIHAEFQLNEPPHFPFWFSPGQFTGHIILTKDATHVRDFKLFVPNHRSLNVDMEWLYGANEKSNMEVDIGYLPQMELESQGPSVPSVIQDENGNVIDSRLPSGEPIQFMFEDIVWQRELSWEKATQQLEVAMYPFKKVTYLPFTEAFDRAKAENKLVHSILLWGALDDQSC